MVDLKGEATVQYTSSEEEDWSHMTTNREQLKGECQSSDAKEYQLKSAIKRVLKCDMDKDNITDPLVLSPVDCVMVAGTADVLSRSKEEFVRNIKKITHLVKPGGQLIFFGVLGATHFLVGGEKYHLFNYDENFIRKILIEGGFTIRLSEILKNHKRSHLIDHKATMFLLAQKTK